MTSAPPRILVVDDERELLGVLSAYLTDRGFEVRCASSGAQALELARHERIDVTLTDLKMPGMDGMETLAALAAIDRTMGVVLMTGFSPETVRLEVLAAGGFLLGKPFELNELHEVLEQALSRTRARRTGT